MSIPQKIRRDWNWTGGLHAKIRLIKYEAARSLRDYLIEGNFRDYDRAMDKLNYIDYPIEVNLHNLLTRLENDLRSEEKARSDRQHS